MSTASYLRPGKNADDKLTQYLGPADTELHDRWLQAAQDRARPEALSTARQLVVQLRGQADKTLRISADKMTTIAGSADKFNEHMRSLFSAGLIGKKGLSASFDVFQLALF